MARSYYLRYGRLIIQSYPNKKTDDWRLLEKGVVLQRAGGR